MSSKSVKNAKKAERKNRSSYWFAMGAMGTVVAYAAVGGKLVPVARAAAISGRLPLPVAVFTQVQAPVSFDIQPGLLDMVTEEFERVTGLDIVLSRSGIGNLPSPGVRGDFVPEKALEQILAGTGVTFRYTASNNITLDLNAVSETVDVTTAPPAVSPSSAKYTESLHDIPQTIQIISQDVIETQGVATLSEVLRNVPGITLQAGEGGAASNTAGDMFNMRGFSANNSIFVDGVRDDGLISRDVFNLEQVEVFLGPTGSDVGRGTAAGYVNIESKTPRPVPLYSGAYEYGSANRKRLTADLNTPLVVGAAKSWLSHSAFRLNGLWQDSGVPGRDLVQLKSQAIAPSLGLGLGTPTRITFASEV